MSISSFTRRSFLKGACIFTGTLFVSVHMAGRAYAAIKDIGGYMKDRINSVYKADAAFKERASQDNVQVQQLYKDYMGKPLSERAEEDLHTKWFDRSAGVKDLQAKGEFPNPRIKEFQDAPYPYEPDYIEYHLKHPM